MSQAKRERTTGNNIKTEIIRIRNESKENLRKEILQKRKNMSNTEILERSKQITEFVIQTQEFKEAKNILLYAPIQNEVDTERIAKETLNLQKNLFYPKVIGEHLIFYKITKEEHLQTGYQSILEPIEGLPAYEGESHTCVIVPGVAFDRKRNRIGYGKGFYDRFLAKHSNNYSIGVCFALQMVDNLPFNELDIPLHRVITENGVD